MLLLVKTFSALLCIIHAYLLIPCCFSKLLESKGGNSKSTKSISSKLKQFSKDRGFDENKNSIERKATCLTLNDVGFKIEVKNGVGYRPVPSSPSKTSVLFPVYYLKSVLIFDFCRFASSQWSVYTNH